MSLYVSCLHMWWWTRSLRLWIVGKVDIWRETGLWPIFVDVIMWGASTACAAQACIDILAHPLIYLRRNCLLYECLFRLIMWTKSIVLSQRSIKWRPVYKMLNYLVMIRPRTYYDEPSITQFQIATSAPWIFLAFKTTDPGIRHLVLAWIPVPYRQGSYSPSSGGFSPTISSSPMSNLHNISNSPLPIALKGAPS